MVNERYRVCRLDDVPTDSFLITEVEDKSIGLIRIDEEVHAVLNYCPHQGADICQGSIGGTIVNDDVGEYTYGLDGRVLRCPWHGWEFDIKTGDGIYPGHENIATFETVVEGEDVYVKL